MGDADGHAFEGAGAMALEVELAFEGVVDRFDQLAYRLEHRLAEALGFVLGRGAQQGDAMLVTQHPLERAPGEALIRDQQHAWVLGCDVGLDLRWRRALRVRRAWDWPAPTGSASRSTCSNAWATARHTNSESDSSG
ncbi:hypothetical protein GCM10010234_77680 [Streptomyces hawaiiensis]